VRTQLLPRLAALWQPLAHAPSRSGEVLTGRAAVEHGLKDPRSTFSSVKRFIVRLSTRVRPGALTHQPGWQGRQLKDVAADAARVQFEGA